MCLINYFSQIQTNEMNIIVLHKKCKIDKLFALHEITIFNAFSVV